MTPADLAAVVRSVARARAGGRRVADAAARIDGRWQETERALAHAILKAPDAASGDVRAFGRVAAADGSREALGRAARLEGTLLAYRGEYAASLAPYERAESLLRGAARDGARLGRASSLLRLGRFDEARGVARAVRVAATRRGDGAITAGAWLSEALALHEGGRPERSLEPYRRARAAFEASGQTYMAAVAAQDEGNALLLLDRFDEAAERLAASVAALDGLGLDREALRWKYNRGALLVATDRLGAADEVLSETEDAFQEAGDLLHASLSRLDRGEALLRAGLVPEAVHALETARAGLLRRAPPAERERANQLLARARVAAGDVSGARRLLAGPPPTGAARDVAARTEIRGRALALDERYAAAAAKLLEAARLYGRLAPASACRARIAASWCALRGGDSAAARRANRSATVQARRLGLASLVHGAAAVRFLIDDAAGRRSAAGRALEEALSSLEELRDGRGPDAMRAALLSGREAWFAAAVRHVLDGDDGVASALELVERWRARALRDLIADSDRIAPRDPELERLRSRVAALERRFDDTQEPAFLRALGRGLDDRLGVRLRDAESALRAAVERRDRAAASPPVPVAATLRALPEGTLVLSSVVDGRGALLICADRGGTVIERAAWTRADLDGWVEELHFRLQQFTVGRAFARRHTRRFGASTDRALRTLADAVLGPFAERIAAARRLVVVPHGPWHRVPFAALPFGASPLATRVPITYAPCLAAGGRRAPAARGRPLVIGLADPAAPAIEDEARSVAAVIPGARLLIGDAARGDALLDRRAAPRCVHVAAHGRYRDDAPAMSALRLADGWLRAADLRLASLRGSVIVLSGCETGVSTVEAIDEAHGLVRGALAAGASEVVASQWRVDDATTCRLMTRFHDLRRRSGTAAALAQSQAELASEGLHPWFWSGFSVWAPSARAASPT